MVSDAVFVTSTAVPLCLPSVFHVPGLSICDGVCVFDLDTAYTHTCLQSAHQPTAHEPWLSSHSSPDHHFCHRVRDTPALFPWLTLGFLCASQSWMPGCLLSHSYNKLTNLHLLTSLCSAHRSIPCTQLDSLKQTGGNIKVYAAYGGDIKTV